MKQTVFIITKESLIYLNEGGGGDNDDDDDDDDNDDLSYY